MMTKRKQTLRRRMFMVLVVLLLLLSAVWFWRLRAGYNYKVVSVMSFLGAFDMVAWFFRFERKPPFPKREDYRIVRRGRSGNVYVAQRRVFRNLWCNLPAGAVGDWCHATIDDANAVISADIERLAKLANDAIPKVKVRHRGEKGHECWLSNSSCGGLHMSGNPAHATVFTYADYGFDNVSKDPRAWVKRWAAYQDLPMEVIDAKTGEVVDILKP